MSIHFIGVDAGGTRTRALLATEAGEVVGVGHAGGANSWSSGTWVADVITEALQGALGSSDPGRVAGGVIAVAGGATTTPRVTAEIAGAWQALGLSGSPVLALDVLAAFAAATVEPRGVVLVAGTGSIAAAIRDGQVTRRSGGHGWLLGDEGSAVWLGLRGIRAALRSIDGRGPQTLLGATIPPALGIEASDGPSISDRIVAEAHGQPPAQLGRLAPIILEASASGDPVARRLVEASASGLVELVTAVIEGEQPTVIVLAGSLLTKAAPIRDAVRGELAERWPEARLAETASGEAGAVAIAISHHTGEPIAEATLARLQGQAANPTIR